jgi:hypothetical protein
LLDDLKLTNLKNQFWQHSPIPFGIIEKNLSEKAFNLNDNKKPTKVLKSLSTPKLTVNLPSILLVKQKKFRVVNKSETKKVNREI